jgi:carboxymethylenebutenolidase
MSGDKPRAGPVTDSYPSGGRAIPVERFAPAAAGPSPAVILLHGADGLTYRGESYRALARDLAGRGFLALLPHYFEATGTRYASFGSQPLHFLTWTQAGADAVGYAAGGRRRVGLLGFSLGAYLSLAVAAGDARVAAVVECFGGFPGPLAAGLRRLPPVLILHGEADRLVPVSEAHRLAGLLEDRGFPYEMKTYPGQGHGFEGAASADATARALAFLTKHLVGERGASAP